MVYRSVAAGWWFSPGTPVSSTNKTNRYDIAKILLKVVLSTITLTPCVFFLQVNVGMRGLLVSWITGVHHQMKLCQDTLFISINIVDRVLDLMQASRDYLQLLGITTILIASKLVYQICLFWSVTIELFRCLVYFERSRHGRDLMVVGVLAAKDFKIILLSNLLILSVPDEGFSRMSFLKQTVHVTIIGHIYK